MLYLILILLFIVVGAAIIASDRNAHSHHPLDNGDYDDVAAPQFRGRYLGKEYRECDEYIPPKGWLRR